MFGFPQFSYDVLRGLRVVAGLGHSGDDRLDDALGVLLDKQREDGRWVLESTPTSMQTSLGQKGKPSKWVTLDALRVIKTLHNARENPTRKEALKHGLRKPRECNYT